MLHEFNEHSGAAHGLPAAVLTQSERPHDIGVSVRADRRIERAIVMTIVVLVILARSAIFVFWEQAHFDSDQAIVGLMAKHLSEGRAFPMFMYGSNYVLAIEAWMSAAVFLVAGASVAALKIPLLTINIVVGLLLVWLLEREAGLRPALAGLAAVFFILPPPGPASELVNANGANLEPFLYVLLIWMTRHRPVLCGLIAGIGFLQREFTIYAPLALLLIGAASGAVRTREGGRRILAAARVAVEVWLVAAVLKTFASPAGPATSLADVPMSNNVANMIGRICVDPTTVVRGVSSLVSEHWVRLFGLRIEPLILFGIESRLSYVPHGTRIVLAAAMALALVRVAMSLAARRRVPGRSFFAVYLMLVGLLSAGAFVVARCGAVGDVRYALLSMIGAVGLAAWFLQVEQRPLLKGIWIALVAAWALDSAVGHGQLWAEYIRNPPPGAKRLIIEHLDARGVRYAMADYWNAYYISFLTRERIIVRSIDVDRIHEYDRLVAAHLGEAVLISRTPCQGASGERILPGTYLCPPPP